MKELNLILLCVLSLVTLVNFALAVSIRRGQRRADRERVQRTLAHQQQQNQHPGAREWAPQRQQ